jgi:hypothetical protein
MPENSFERLGTPTAPRAEVNKVGPGWGLSASRATADDPKLHLPLSTPAPAAHPPPPYVPPPPQPSLAQHRDALAAALEQQKATDAKLASATEAHARALKLIEERRQALSAYATLADDRLAQTLDSLRDDDGAVTLPGADDRLIKREIARLDLEDAERAEATLLHELIPMREQADAAARQANMLATSILSHVADRIADEHAEALAQAAVRKEVLHEFDQFSANSGVRLSGRVSSILLANGTAGIAALTKLRDPSSWRAARDKLLADPHAEIVIDTPVPPARPATPTAWPVITNREVISAKDLTMEDWEALRPGRRVTAA